jgi:integrase
MRGTMRERSPGTWELRVYLGVDPVTRKKKYRSRTHHGPKRSAESELARLVSEVERAGPVTEATLDRLLREWLEIHGPDLAVSTRHEYERLIRKRISPALGHLQLRKLQVNELERFYRSLVDGGLAPRSVRQVHSIIRRALTVGTQWGWVTHNVAVVATVPKQKRRRITPPSAGEVVAVLAAAVEEDPEFFVLLRLAAATGARRGELCGLRWRDVDLRNGSIHVHRSIVEVNGKLYEKDTKTEQERTVTIDAGTIAILRAHGEVMADRANMAGRTLKPAAFVFSRAADSSTPLRPDLATKGFRALCDRVGLSKTTRLHDLRHAHATELLDRGIPIKTVQERLGHADATTTMNIYAHAIAATDETAARTIGNVLDAAPYFDLPSLDEKADGS